MNEKRLAYLQAIGDHSGQWTWYQLDRFLSARDVRLVDGMTEFLVSLQREDLISVERRNDLDYYGITARGKQVLAAAASK